MYAKVGLELMISPSNLHLEQKESFEKEIIG